MKDYDKNYDIDYDIGMYIIYMVGQCRKTFL